MSDLDSQLEEVKSEILEVQRRVARSEYERDTANRARLEALSNLKALGAESEKAAVDLLASLKEELAEELRRVQTELADGE